VSCKITSNNWSAGGASTIRYQFDKAVNITNPTGFFLAGFQLIKFQASTTAAVDGTDPNAVFANFAWVGANNPVNFTVCGATGGNAAAPFAAAVNNVSSGGVTNPLG